jgi:hypothetical protein
MASAKNIEFGNYCDRVYNELSGMKSRLLGFVKEIEGMKGREREMVESHIPHFHDIIRTIDWKLEILTKVCPFEWSGFAGVERTASVLADEDLSREQTVSGGYGGG